MSSLVRAQQYLYRQTNIAVLWLKRRDFLCDRTWSAIDMDPQQYNCVLIKDNGSL